MRQISKMGNFWIFIPHFARGVTGVLLHAKLPNSHDIVKVLHFEKEPGSISFNDVHQKVKKDVEAVFMTFAINLKLHFKVYFGLTILCAILDSINFLICLKHFGVAGQEYEEITLLILTIFLYATNIYWTGYISLLYYKFPSYITQSINSLMTGAGTKFNDKISKWTSKAEFRIVQAGRQPQVEDPPVELE